MIRTAFIACLALCACTPEQKATEGVPPIPLPGLGALPSSLGAPNTITCLQGHIPEGF